jgi:Xaa-Pro aminopeptidase
MFVPQLEEPAARADLGTDIAIETWQETDDPYLKVLGRFEASGDAPSEIAVSDRMWALHVLRFQGRRASATWSSATALMRELRMVKDADEIALLRLAAHAADRVVEQIAAGRLVGRKESDVAREVHERLLAEGHDTAEFGIVASGPNSASPHHQASDRVIAAGEPIVLDIGGILGGYCSDTTRTLWVTGGDPAKGPTEEFRHLFGILQTAQERATTAVRPGVACAAIDAAARDVIDAEGFGEAFFHRTGHGIGLEGHEEPYIIAGNDEPLQAGIAFSVEPGIYLAGRYGARIEDIVVCGPDGPDTLNVSSRGLYVVDG